MSEQNQFLCLCDLLCSSSSSPVSMTRTELESWASYVLNKPIRALYPQGRKLRAALREPGATEESCRATLDIGAIRTYCSAGPTTTTGDLLALGQMMEVLGKHASALPAHGELITEFVSFYSQEDKNRDMSLEHVIYIK